MEKDTAFSFRLPRDLLEQFNATAKAQDTPAAQILRDLMRRYIAANGPTATPEPPITEKNPPPSPKPKKPAKTRRNTPQTGGNKLLAGLLKKVPK
jgi:hypothetical protein